MQWLHPHLFFFWAGRGRGRRGTVERWVRVILYVQKRKTKTNRNTSLIISYQILHRLKYDYTITPARWEGRDSAFLRLTPVTQSCSARSEGRNSGWVLWDVRSPPEQVGWLVGWLPSQQPWDPLWFPALLSCELSYLSVHSLPYSPLIQESFPRK